MHLETRRSGARQTDICRTELGQKPWSRKVLEVTAFFGG